MVKRSSGGGIMSARWSAEEHKTLKSLLADGVELNLLKKHLPNRSHDALHRQAQKYGYGVNTVDGVKRLYDGKKTRVHEKKAEEEATEDANNTVGETRTMNNGSTPTMVTSEQTTQNVSDVMIPDSAHNFNRAAFLHLSDDISKLLNSEHYALKSVSAILEDFVLTVCKNASVLGVKS